MKNRVEPRYKTNKSIKKKIDKLLEQNARNISNCGTGSMFDIGDEKCKSEWTRMEAEIKQMDSLFFDRIKD